MSIFLQIKTKFIHTYPLHFNTNILLQLINFMKIKLRYGMLFEKTNMSHLRPRICCLQWILSWQVTPLERTCRTLHRICTIWLCRAALLRGHNRKLMLQWNRHALLRERLFEDLSKLEHLKREIDNDDNVCINRIEDLKKILYIITAILARNYTSWRSTCPLTSNCLPNSVF